MNIRTANPITTTMISNVHFVIQLQINSERHMALQIYHMYIYIGHHFYYD